MIYNTLTEAVAAAIAMPKPLADWSFTVSTPPEAPTEPDVQALCGLHQAGVNLAGPWGLKGLANPDGTINSAWGYLLHVRRSCGTSRFAKADPFTPWQWGELSLKRGEPVVSLPLTLPAHLWFGNKDVPRGLHLTFRQGGGALHLTAVMQVVPPDSLLPDTAYFCSLLHRMRRALRTHWDLGVGTYTHYGHLWM